jgi:hypothetical protein
MTDHIQRLASKTCHFCDHPQHFEVVVELHVRCAHSPVGVCKRHLQQGVKYALSCVDAGDYVYVGVIGDSARERPRVQH